MEEHLTFRLPGIIHERSEQSDFEGPLNLILSLLSKNKVEIRDIRISDILDQYLEFISRAPEMDLELASEFVQMASHLVYIKTRMLLAEEPEEVTELELLISSLEKLRDREQLEQVRSVTTELQRRYAGYSLMLTKPPEPRRTVSGEYRYRHEPVELLRALHSVYSRGAALGETPAERIMPRPIVYNVREKSRELIEKLRGGEIPLALLYAACSSRSELVATFIAVLELAGMGSLTLEIRDGELITAIAFDGDPEELLERIVE